MKKLIFLLLSIFLLSCNKETKEQKADRFIRIEGPDLIKPNGEKFLVG